MRTLRCAVVIAVVGTIASVRTTSAKEGFTLFDKYWEHYDFGVASGPAMGLGLRLNPRLTGASLLEVQEHLTQSDPWDDHFAGRVYYGLESGTVLVGAPGALELYDFKLGPNADASSENPTTLTLQGGAKSLWLVTQAPDTVVSCSLAAPRTCAAIGLAYTRAEVH
jgi:hypothetical protein